MNEERIDRFVASISDATLTKLFRSYNLGLYDHLLEKQRKAISKCEERQALQYYLRFIMNEKERLKTMAPCVQAMDEPMLIDLICEDEFMEESLMHLVNECTPWGKMSPEDTILMAEFLARNQE